MWYWDFLGLLGLWKSGVEQRYKILNPKGRLGVIERD